MFFSTNHRGHQFANDNIDIESSVGRGFQGKQSNDGYQMIHKIHFNHMAISFISEKEDIDAPVDSADDHVMHWTDHIRNIHHSGLFD